MNGIIKAKLTTEWFLSDIEQKIRLVALQLFDDPHYTREEAAIELRKVAHLLHEENSVHPLKNPHRKDNEHGEITHNP